MTRPAAERPSARMLARVIGEIDLAKAASVPAGQAYSRRVELSGGPGLTGETVGSPGAAFFMPTDETYARGPGFIPDEKAIISPL